MIERNDSDSIASTIFRSVVFYMFCAKKKEDIVTLLATSWYPRLKKIIFKKQFLYSMLPENILKKK